MSETHDVSPPLPPSPLATSALLTSELLTAERPVLPDGYTPEQVIAALEPLSEERRKARILDVVRQRVGSVTVLMDMPRDPHNGAAVVRSADAFGVPEVHVVQREPTFFVGHRVAQGTERWVEVIAHQTAEDAVATLHARGFRLIATHPNGALVPEDLRKLERVCLVLGNEHDGISEVLARAADDSVRIPMRGFVESLNLSVAAAVFLNAALAGRPGDLSSAEVRRWYAAGLVRSVPRSEEILAAFREQSSA